MDYAMMLSGAIALIIFLLGAVTWFLKRLISQNDTTHIENKEQFKELINEVIEVKTTLQDHKTDVAVIKEQINHHSQGLKDVEQLFHRVRVVENDIAVIQTRQIGH